MDIHNELKIFHAATLNKINPLMIVIDEVRMFSKDRHIELTWGTMIPYSRPPPVGAIKNYSIVCLDGDFKDVKLISWLGSLRDFRAWCFNNTNSRYQFGSKSHCCAMIPEKGYLFVYITYGGKWLMLVIEGSTSYLVGFITSSISGKQGLGIREINPQIPRDYIQGSKKMPWKGDYRHPESVQVGAGSLRSAFRGMYRYTSQELPQPRDTHVRQWCTVFVIHFPEARRFDSLALCNIYNRFVDGGRLGDESVEKARTWSSDCIASLQHLKLIAEANNNDKRRNTKSRGTESLSEKKGKDMITIEAQKTLKNVRMFTRARLDHELLALSSLPVQLLDGQIVGVFPEELDVADAEKKKFLIEPVDCYGVEGDVESARENVGTQRLGNTNGGCILEMSCCRRWPMTRELISLMINLIQTTGFLL
ncbi:hypothetical protein C2845_PM07G22640 [Panicum miliaceum]|uniref:Uncharacterized protein n=1 Tax=Panicum miliaceum TaxID=4540 RepID=A0A3L6SNA2_PANMI|nr:hypothetical protein C2845_PM07G22640 [Panicum miliaceum]